MKVQEYKFQEVKEGGKKVFILRHLQIFNTVWVGIDKFKSEKLAKLEEIRLNNEGPCLVKWEFINRDNDKDDLDSLVEIKGVKKDSNISLEDEINSLEIKLSKLKSKLVLEVLSKMD